MTNPAIFTLLFKLVRESPSIIIPILNSTNSKCHNLLDVEWKTFRWTLFISYFRPCYICSIIFFTAVGLLCWSDSDSCIFWPSCDTVFNGEMCAYVREKRQWLSWSKKNRKKESFLCLVLYFRDGYFCCRLKKRLNVLFHALQNYETKHNFNHICPSNEIQIL